MLFTIRTTDGYKHIEANTREEALGKARAEERTRAAQHGGKRRNVLGVRKTRADLGAARVSGAHRQACAPASGPMATDTGASINPLTA